MQNPEYEALPPSDKKLLHNIFKVGDPIPVASLPPEDKIRLLAPKKGKKPYVLQLHERIEQLKKENRELRGALGLPPAPAEEGEEADGR